MWARWPESSPAMSPMRSSGAVISTLTIGSSTMGRALTCASRKAVPPADEGDVLGIHRVALAVVHGDAHVLQRVAGDQAGLEHAAHAFLDRLDELVRNRAAFHRVDELEALAARQRLRLDVHLAEPPRAAGLLRVPAVALGG